MANRFLSLVSVIFVKQCCTIVGQADQLEIRSYDEIIYGSCYRNLTTSSMQECLQYCLSDCLCLSFQICGNTCQLSSTTAALVPTAMRRKSTSCRRFEFKHKTHFVHKDNCGSCTSGINCCLTSQPCFNDGVCKPLVNDDTRFTCECSSGYTGHRCTEKAKSCRAFLHKKHKDGLFEIYDDENQSYTVFCSFDANMTWTLVQSFKYSKKGPHDSPLFKNRPKNEHNPSWKDYRLSKSRMKHIQQDSNLKWRLTCNFDSDGTVYTDYVQASYVVVPLLSTNDLYDDCKTVEFINIRGQYYTNRQVRIAHKGSQGLHIHSYHSGIMCQTMFPESKECDDGPGEDNFGRYKCRNKKHRCSSSDESTTQLWFGGQ